MMKTRGGGGLMDERHFIPQSMNYRRLLLAQLELVELLVRYDSLIKLLIASGR